MEAESAGIGYSATDLTITGGSVSAQSISSNATETRASVTIDINSIPLENETLTV